MADFVRRRRWLRTRVPVVVEASEGGAEAGSASGTVSPDARAGISAALQQGLATGKPAAAEEEPLIGEDDSEYTDAEAGSEDEVDEVGAAAGGGSAATRSGDASQDQEEDEEEEQDVVQLQLPPSRFN